MYLLFLKQKVKVKAPAIFCPFERSEKPELGM